MNPARASATAIPAALALAVLVALAPPASAAISFQAPFRSLASGVTSRGVAIGDLDGDGFLDAVTTSYVPTSEVVILRGTSGGGFLDPVSIPAGDLAYAVAVGDVNGDGHLDIVTANQTTSVSLLLGHGDGTFEPHVEFPTPNTGGTGTSRNILIADLDGDGRGDVVVTCRSPNVVSILPGQVGGTLGAHIDLPFSTTLTLSADDANGDGHVDLLVNDGGVDSLRVLLGHGDFTFGSSFALSNTAESPLRISQSKLARIDGDDVPDLVFEAASTSNTFGPGRIGVCLGNGDGTFGPVTAYDLSIAPGRLTVADFDGDGHADVAVRCNLDTYAAVVTLLRGQGDGTLGSPSQSPTAPEIGTAVAAADFDGDGRADLVAPSRTGGTLALHPGRADGTLGQLLSFGIGTTPLGYGPTAIAAGDVNGDGSLDLATVSGNPASATVLLGDGHAHFGAPVSSPMHLGVAYIALADFDGDGHLDLATANDYSSAAPSNTTVSVFLGSGDGTFGAGTTFETGAPPGRLKVADLDGDGHPDLIAANGTILLGIGDGTFQPGFHAWPGAWILGVGRIDAGTTPDLVAANAARDSVLVLLGRGDGAFDFASSVAASTARDAAVGDLDGDGVSDLVFDHAVPGSVWGSGGLSVMRGAGDGTFTPSDEIGARSIVSVPSLDDLDGDGRLDVSFATAASALAAFSGNGDGTFAVSTADFGMGSYAWERALGDFDGDGRLDVAAADQDVGMLNLLLNTSTGTTAVPPLAADAGRLALAGAIPNPARGRSLTVAFALAGREPARLEVFDVAGRRLAAREVGALGPGAHRVEIASGARLAPGLYLLRLEQAGRVATGRAVVTD